MSERVISQANLNGIERSISSLGRQMDFVSSMVDTVQNQVATVDKRVEIVYSDFCRFVDMYRQKTLLIETRQEIESVSRTVEKEFGHYETIRRHAIGILQASDLEVIKKETIYNVTERLMLDAPGYWLAPALVALAAWIMDNKELADKALKEAMKRDDEKTSLFFSLVNRRADRFDSATLWLDRYFGMQDPYKMERKITVVLDGYANGIYGPDAKGMCANKIKRWIQELSEKDGFIEEQREQWSKALGNMQEDSNGEDYPILVNKSPTWSELSSVLQWARAHKKIGSYFKEIFDSHSNQKGNLKEKTDKILMNLVQNFDAKELPKRLELKRLSLIIEEQGNVDKADKRFDIEAKAYEEYEDFSQHLTSIALASEANGAMKNTQKLAISLSKEWIIDAYEDLTAKKRSKVPNNVVLKIAEWKGSTTDGGNETQLVSEMKDHMKDKMEKKLEDVKLEGKHWGMLITGICLAGYGLMVMNTILILIGLIGPVYLFFGMRGLEPKREDIRQYYDGIIEDSEKVIKGFCAEVVDFFCEYEEEDAYYEGVRSYLMGISPHHFIENDDKKRRMILNKEGA